MKELTFETNSSFEGDLSLFSDCCKEIIFALTVSFFTREVLFIRAIWGLMSFLSLEVRIFRALKNALPLSCQMSVLSHSLPCLFLGHRGHVFKTQSLHTQALNLPYNLYLIFSLDKAYIVLSVL